MTLPHIDMPQAQGLVLQIGLMIFAKLSAYLGAISLHDVSLLLAITVAVDSLTGSPIKNFFINLRKRIGW